VQIAGLIAAPIVPSWREGQAISAGDRFGLIRFGSRVDVYLPEGTRPIVSQGQDHDRGGDGDRRPADARGRAKFQGELSV